MYFRLDINLVKGLTKHTLNTYFSGLKIDPKYAFLHTFFLICSSCPYQNLSLWPKSHTFFPILHVFAPLNDVRAYIAWSWKTNVITWNFFTRMISNFKYKCPLGYGPLFRPIIVEKTFRRSVPYHIVTYLACKVIGKWRVGELYQALIKETFN